MLFAASVHVPLVDNIVVVREHTKRSLTELEHGLLVTLHHYWMNVSLHIYYTGWHQETGGGYTEGMSELHVVGSTVWTMYEVVPWSTSQPLLTPRGSPESSLSPSSRSERISEA